MMNGINVKNEIWYIPDAHIGLGCKCAFLSFIKKPSGTCCVKELSTQLATLSLWQRWDWRSQIIPQVFPTLSEIAAQNCRKPFQMAPQGSQRASEVPGVPCMQHPVSSRGVRGAPASDFLYISIPLGRHGRHFKPKLGKIRIFMEGRTRNF